MVAELWKRCKRPCELERIGFPCGPACRSGNMETGGIIRLEAYLLHPSRNISEVRSIATNAG